MRTLCLIAIVLSIGIGATAQTKADGQTEATGQTIPSWKVADLQHYIQSAKKPIIISVWATYCQPCVQEIPYFQSTLKAVADGKVDMLLLSLDLGTFYPDKIEAFAQKHNFYTPIAWLNETDADVFGPAIDATWTGAMPCSIFYNPSTGYRKFYPGQLSPDQFKEALKALMN